MQPPLSPETIVGTSIEGQDVTWAQIASAAQDVREWVALKLTSGSCSTELIYQLAGHLCRMPQWFGDRALLVDIHAVYDQVGELEKAPLTRAAPTKRAEPFTAGPLQGLWHKHWFQADFLMTNLLKETEKNGEMLIRRRLDEVFGRNGWEGQILTKDLAGQLADAMVDGALEHRAGRSKKPSRLTGEWIVFAKGRGGRNIYLTLAGHGETNEAIFKRCALAPKEFPELSSTPPFSEEQAAS